MPKIREWTYILLGMMFLWGCSATQSYVSSTHLNDKQVEILGTAIGESSAYYFLGLRMNGNDSISVAVDNALKQKGGDTLINVFVDKEQQSFLSPYFIRDDTTKIRGTAVRYKNISNASLSMQKYSESEQPKVRSSSAEQMYGLLYSTPPEDRNQLWDNLNQDEKKELLKYGKTQSGSDTLSDRDIELLKWLSRKKWKE